MKNPDWKQLEAAAFACWPAREQIERHGWVWRASEGFTKRANSINVLTARPDDPAGLIAEGREFFAQRSLRPVFRLLSVVDNTGLDAKLAEAGLAKVEPSLVMTRQLAPDATRPIPGSTPVDEWMKAYRAVSDDENDPVHAKHRILLGRLPANHLFLVLTEQGRPIACGIGVIHGEIVSLLDIRVRPDCRGRGVGRALVSDILAWAAARGARWAMLQVVENNRPAVRLYTRAGFAPAYGYFYRA